MNKIIANYLDAFIAFSNPFIDKVLSLGFIYVCLFMGFIAGSVAEGNGLVTPYQIHEHPIIQNEFYLLLIIIAIALYLCRFFLKKLSK
jgi:hypothetical protein